MKMAKPKAVREHWDRVAALGCVISGAFHPTLHHCHGGSLRNLGIHKGVGQKTSDFLVIPLAAIYHTGRYGADILPIFEWERLFGTQEAHLDEVSRRLGYSVWELAGVTRKIQC
jgi:hypothetical protein